MTFDIIVIVALAICIFKIIRLNWFVREVWDITERIIEVLEQHTDINQLTNKQIIQLSNCINALTQIYGKLRYKNFFEINKN